jgi:hypothetical protein
MITRQPERAVKGQPRFSHGILSVLFTCGKSFSSAKPGLANRGVGNAALGSARRARDAGAIAGMLVTLSLTGVTGRLVTLSCAGIACARTGVLVTLSCAGVAGATLSYAPSRTGVASLFATGNAGGVGLVVGRAELVRLAGSQPDIEIEVVSRLVSL